MKPFACLLIVSVCGWVSYHLSAAPIPAEKRSKKLEELLVKRRDAALNEFKYRKEDFFDGKMKPVTEDVAEEPTLEALGAGCD